MERDSHREGRPRTHTRAYMYIHRVAEERVRMGEREIQREEKLVFVGQLSALRHSFLVVSLCAVATASRTP